MRDWETYYALREDIHYERMDAIADRIYLWGMVALLLSLHSEGVTHLFFMGIAVTSFIFGTYTHWSNKR